MFGVTAKGSFSLLHSMLAGCATHESVSVNSRLGHIIMLNGKFPAWQPTEPFATPQEPRGISLLDKLKHWPIFTDSILCPLARFLCRADLHCFHYYYNIAQFWKKSRGNLRKLFTCKQVPCPPRPPRQKLSSKSYSQSLARTVPRDFICGENTLLIMKKTA